jgi:imidazolonepropionase-like amidohydrolase
MMMKPTLTKTSLAFKTLIMACVIFSGLPMLMAQQQEPIVNLIYTEKGLAGKQQLIPQGEFKYKGLLEVGWNNRRVKVEEYLRVNSDGLPVEYSAKGVSAFGSAIDESFEWQDGVARWNSTKDQGEVKETRRRFYLPADEAVAANNMLVKVLLNSPTRSVDLFPTGVARLKVLESHTLNNTAGNTKVHLYALLGLGFTPDFAWYDDQGNFFAKNLGGFMRIIRQGFSLDDFDQLTAIQTKAEEQHLLSVAKKLSKPYQQLLIKNVDYVDVVEGKKVNKMDVLLEAGQIKKIGKNIKVKKDVSVIDGKGKTLIPGLWDMHGHLSKEQGMLNIAAGVTSVRDIGNNHDNIMQIESLFNNNTMIGTHVYRAGFMDQESEYSAGLSVKSLEEALQKVDWFADNGYLQVKLYSSIDPSWVRPIADRAHNRGMRLSGHIPAFMTAEQAVAAGYDEIQHINMLFLNFLAGDSVDTRKQLRFSLIGEKAGEMDLSDKKVKDFIQLLADKNIVVDATVATFRSMLLAKDKTMDVEFAAVANRLPPTIQRSLKGAVMHVEEAQFDDYKAGADALVNMIKVLYDAGVTIVPGTDHIAGFTLQRELELYVNAGIPTIKVLEMASLTSAKVVGVAHKTGSITEGKAADLVLVDGDPTNNITDLRKTELVFKGSNYYQSEALHKELGVLPISEVK